MLRCSRACACGDWNRYRMRTSPRSSNEPSRTRSAGSRARSGYNILIYPEGKLTVGGPLQPFKAGAGLIAVEGGTPIVPVKLKIHKMSIIDRRRLPASLRGDVELVIGEPMWFDAETDHAAATTRLEAAVAAL